MPQSEIHSIGTVDELPEIAQPDPADFPDAKGGTVRTDGTKA